MEFSHITIRGARVHNLKNISLDIPRNRFVVITGISGSGKSSLAFDTIFAEGQRRFMETLSPYARQFIGNIERPDVDFIEGLSPVIAIDQKSTSRSPRSTVGTITEVHDFIRLLYAKAGRRYDPVTGQMLQKQSPESIVESIQSMPVGTKVSILSPLVSGRKGHYRELFERLLLKGFLRVRIDGEEREMEKNMQIERYKTHSIELVIDRLVIGPESAERLQQAIGLAIGMSEHRSSVICTVLGDESKELFFSTQYAYSDGSVPVDTLAPNHFSFNSPYGACPECNGLGELMQLSADLMIPDPSLSLNQGGIEPFGKPGKRNLWQIIKAIAKQFGFTLDTPVSEIPPKALDILLLGSGSRTFDVAYGYAGKEHSYPQIFQGALPYVEEMLRNSSSTRIREWTESFMIHQPCPVCKGARLRQESLHVRINGMNIAEAESLPLPETLDFFRNLPEQLNERERLVAVPVLHEITKRIEFLLDVGLGYLALCRSARTLSGGEAQRIRLASQLGSRLSGVLYILDEPSIGLHQRDNHKLIASLQQLRDIGNTVLVVEHDKDTMLMADEIIDLGPGAGEYGGEIVAKGPASELGNASLTAAYLTGRKNVFCEPEQGKERTEPRFLDLYGCRGNNLQNIDVRFPLGSLVAVTGVSGSGKSTLINETLYPVLARHFYRSKLISQPHAGIAGIELIDKVVNVDQTPIGRTPRSNPATYTGAFTFIRDFFTRLPEAQIRGYKAGRFSFNVKGGRCEVCQGAGTMKIEMNFLPDVYVPCENCKGQRYNRETLQVKYKGKSIADVLEMPIEEAAEFFMDFPRIRRILSTMESVGLGYLKLGQPSPLLSGGEAQRIKLSAELAKIQTGKTLYILDEPTTGLHFQDIQHLLEVLRRLVDKGNTVIIIEHNLDIIRNSDWIIDLGPEGGSGGGMLIAEGTPSAIAEIEHSHTGRFLKLEMKEQQG
ncbi:MAG: excinuclease ABC subunit UvrA [Chlorobium sp.]|uniref:excinuclease ABC subunit UvrA n=1 Tax=Chlorobium sp. TaxID=1095 RepID=UPI001DD84F08|nr:excinuclease ABC subunit UvrA [Chlorobium sp.]MBN1279128.1 excinuclease ABC subunit UvrA [Chlorobiaceae bacterium]MCF8215311.1 excinuclease ABC subunit UvrA [Chlorobium sp.]MCF8270148.1 excinuclease ABC subunit UvrA [Chlorobium sp.]MCF8286518.1 excinuclease ABC subunit UvrA [Chlorobium sp.]MCF8290116.1 excinuclease ABC subunit UvrA [Chlorobium sp.]